MSHYKEIKIGKEIIVAIFAIAKNQGLPKWARDFLSGLSRNFPGMPGEVQRARQRVREGFMDSGLDSVYFAFN